MQVHAWQSLRHSDESSRLCVVFGREARCADPPRRTLNCDSYFGEKPPRAPTGPLSYNPEMAEEICKEQQLQVQHTGLGYLNSSAVG